MTPPGVGTSPRFARQVMQSERAAGASVKRPCPALDLPEDHARRRVGLDLLAGEGQLAGRLVDREGGDVVRVEPLGVQVAAGRVEREVARGLDPGRRPVHRRNHAGRLHQTQMLKDAAQMVDDGKLKPILDRVYPLTQAGEAQWVLEAGETVGRVVLEI